MKATGNQHHAQTNLGQAVVIFIPGFDQLPLHFIAHQGQQFFELVGILRPEPSITAAAQAVEVLVTQQLCPEGILSVGQNDPAKLTQGCASGLQIVLRDQAANLFVPLGLLGQRRVHVHNGTGVLAGVLGRCSERCARLECLQIVFGNRLLPP